jgi:NAD(P)-dependent dehydrogenase (short-subunit alcohol dehydrogenase family)/3-hydroxymyristoyl/3-hydroxydecanoyl-(acyl carrier protein) dehydratase
MTEHGLPRPDIRETQPLKGKTAVITGSSRGIGAEIAKSLAEAGVNIIGNHVDPASGKVRRQERVNEEIKSYRVQATSVLADITEPEGRLALLDAAVMPEGTTQPRNIDYLILNAAGGLEEGKPEGWAEKINIEAQLALVDEFLPHMNHGGKIIYLTSLWAHRYGEMKQLPSYEPVARTKNAAERLLRERIPQLDERGVSLGILSGHVIKGTAAHTLFRRAYAERLAQIEQTAEGGVFPEAVDMGNAVRDMLLLGFESGYTKYVGGTEAESLDPDEQKPKILNRGEVAKRLPMYGDNKLLVDEFDVQEGIGRYTVREEDCDGHFANDYEEIKLFRGVDQVEAAAQTLGLAFLASEPDTKVVPVFRSTEGTKFGFVFPGETMIMQATITSQTRNSVKGNCEIRIGDKIVSTINGIDLGLISSIEMAKRMIDREKATRK